MMLKMLLGAMVKKWVRVFFKSLLNKKIHINCPTDSTLSPGCIIDATDAEDTSNTFMYSPGGTPADVVFYAGSGNYDGTTIVCNSGTSPIDLTISIIFIIGPILLTFYQLYHAVNKWKRIDVLSQWISNHVQFLYFISAITGSAFAGVAVCTSNAFNLPQTDMPLNKTQLLQFQTKRIYSTVLVENVPQIGLQIWLLTSYGSGNDIIYISMAFSILSVVISVLTTISQRNVVRSQDYAIIQYDITGPVIVANMNQCRNSARKLQIQIAALLGVNRYLIEVTRAKEIKNGLSVEINVFVNNATAIDMNIEKEMHDSNQSGKLAEIMKISWDLDAFSLLSIGNVKCSKYESKERRVNKVFIECAPSQVAKNTSIMMSKIVSESEMSPAESEGYVVQSLPPKIPSVHVTSGAFNDESVQNKALSVVTTKGNEKPSEYTMNAAHSGKDAHHTFVEAIDEPDIIYAEDNVYSTYM